MVKVVTNRCFGGFTLSIAGARRMAELGHPQAIEEIAEYDAKLKDRRKQSATEKKWGLRWYGSGICHGREERTDPILVQVVEEMGEGPMGHGASGELSKLVVTDVPDDAKWHIHDYDGLESIHEDHREWR